MKLSTLLTTATIALLTPALAAPVESDATSATSSGGKTPQVAATAKYGTPRCKSTALFDLCTASNADAYCDANGFHCNFMASCKGVCWCE